MAELRIPMHRSGFRRPLWRSGAKKLSFISAIGLLLASGVVLNAAGSASAAMGQDGPSIMAILETQSLDGSGNNRAHPDWGRAGTQYSRVGPARYADGRSAQVGGPNNRAVSNRIFNDVNQNLFSERGVTQWGFAWGQFIDHNVGLRAAPGVGNSPDPGENIPFNPSDPLESFTNNLGSIPFTRSEAAPGTGVTNPRQQTNIVGTYIDASAVYGDANARLEWMREGPVNGSLADNGPHLINSNGYLPRRDARGNPATAPVMDIDGRLRAQPNRAMVAGDVRANENMALTATQTLFMREHNRIVDSLPRTLSANDRFQIARRIVISEIQYITYNEFLPAMGVRLPSYRGYNPNVNANLSNEFATVGFRAHSQIHGEFELETQAARYSAATLAALEAMGIEIERDGADIALVIPLNVAFFNPDMLTQVQLGPALQGLGLESQYKNDEQIDNQLRSVLFQVPVPGNPECLDGPTLPQCFRGVVDLGAIDGERGRDHGMPSYNQMRVAYGLPAKTSFTSITGEATDAFPRDPLLTPGNEVNDPNSLDFVQLFDINGRAIPLTAPEAETDATRGVRRTTTAARLRAVFGSVNNLDAFTGMVAEAHVAGAEFGELQLAIWRNQFQALRDGDRFFYQSPDAGLDFLRASFGVEYRRTLAQVIAANTDIPTSDMAANVFRTPAGAAIAATEEAAATSAVLPSGRGVPGSPAGVVVILGLTFVGRGRSRRRTHGR